MNITELLGTGASVNLTVSAVDLKEFALSLIAEARRLGADAPKEDKELTAKEAAEQLGVSTNSLWRWRKAGYLVPRKRIGSKVIYLQSQLDALKDNQ